MAIKPSLIQSRSGFAMAKDPKRISTAILSRSSYACRRGELLRISASIAAAAISKPPADSSLRNSVRRSVIFRIVLSITMPDPSLVCLPPTSDYAEWHCWLLQRGPTTKDDSRRTESLKPILKVGPSSDIKRALMAKRKALANLLLMDAQTYQALVAYEPRANPPKADEAGNTIKLPSSLWESVNLAIDSELRGCDLVSLQPRDVTHGNQVLPRALVVQRKARRFVQVELTEPIRSVVGESKRLREREHPKRILTGFSAVSHKRRQAVCRCGSTRAFHVNLALSAPAAGTAKRSFTGHRKLTTVSSEIDNQLDDPK